MGFNELNILKKSEEIERVVEEKVKPMLAFDGGSLEIIDIKPGNGDEIQVFIRYLGACSTCSSSGGATLFAIEESLRKNLDTSLIRVLPV